jgi:hypothetical protein
VFFKWRQEDFTYDDEFNEKINNYNKYKQMLLENNLSSKSESLASQRK